MRHVRALSPYSRWQEGGDQCLNDNKSFLSAYAGNSANQNNPINSESAM